MNTQGKKMLQLENEIADRIALASLKDMYQYTKTELKSHIEEGTYLHPEDVAKNHQLIYALELLIPFYGGEL
jgi:hypothetical protein